MKKTEMAQVLAVIKTAYPHFEITEPVARLWYELLKDVDLQTSQANLHKHIRSNRFPPTIADIIHDQDDEPEEDPEIRARNIEIAHAQWVRDGNDPEAFVYDSIKRLRA
ncbi:replicative helicase loader/inhibitor [Paenibacillus elgii]|uniref:replicative helicase loader/inhibitor n=1 Tax=Paenibacillus elgii TaxID=189691 RepID=UPI002041B605|nr:replicative helicase loader/inhibitor [Paenibacillus elgii]MCM3272590.1 replicative helicase loader/inhibitor [Paenibacillus elgii]